MSREQTYLIKYIYESEVKITYTGKTNISIYVNKPINLNSQIIKNSKIDLYDPIYSNKILQEDCISFDVSTSLYPIHKLVWSNPKSNFIIKQIVEATLFKTKLEEIDPIDFIKVEPLPDLEKNYYLKTVFPITEDFKQFINFNKLFPQKFSSGGIVTTESIICFAYRIVQYIGKNIHYCLENGDQEPMETIKLGKANCSSFSNLFSSIMILNGICCRIVFGQFISGKQFHAKNEFFDPSLGWVAVECSRLNPTINDINKTFGVDDGIMIGLSTGKLSCVPDYPQEISFAIPQLFFKNFLNKKPDFCFLNEISIFEYKLLSNRKLK